MVNSLSDIREREVINVCDGRRIGCVCDVLIELPCGQITALLVNERVFGFCGKDTVKIEWGQIVCFGEDAILVDIGKKCREGSGGEKCHPDKKKSWFFNC